MTALGGLSTLLPLCGFAMMNAPSAETAPCPTELLKLPPTWSSMQQQTACMDTFLAVVASDAVYHNSSHQWLQYDSRPEARFLKPVKSIEGGVQVFVVESIHTVVVAFAGTDNLADVWTDMQYYQTDKLPVDVHAGFYEQSLRMNLHDLIRYLDDGMRLVVCGHSLGGAAAQVLTLRLLHEGRLAAQYRANQQVQCITFGAPQVAASLPGYDSSLFLNYVHENDLIVKLLLLKTEILGKLVKAFEHTGLRSMLESLARQTYSQSPWYLQLVAAFGQGLFDSYWKSESETFPYTPFGYFLFLSADGGFYHVRLASDSASDVHSILRTPETLKTFLSFRQALKDHRIANYAEALESIRAQTTCQNSGDENRKYSRADYHDDSAKFFEGTQVVGFGGLLSFPKTGMILNLTTLDWLKALPGPFYSIVCAGQGRSGKSLILSMIAGDDSLFPSSDAAQPVTEGLDLAVIRVKSAYVLLLDAEGGDNAMAKFHALVNVMGLLLGQILVWFTGGTIPESAFNLLGQMIASSDIVTFHGNQLKSLLFFVANKCTLRITASDFEKSLATTDEESVRSHPRSIIQERFPLKNRRFYRLPLLQDRTFTEEFSKLLHGIGGGLAAMSPLSVDALWLDGTGVATLIQMIFDNVRDLGTVDMPSVVESIILNGYLLPEAKQRLKRFETHLPQLSPGDFCIGDASAHDARGEALVAYANFTRAKVPKHSGMASEAQSWLKTELEKVWNSWEANNTAAAHTATAFLFQTANDLARQFENGLPKSSKYQTNLGDYDTRDWFLQQYDAKAHGAASCLGTKIGDARLNLLEQLRFSWRSFFDVNKALGKELAYDEIEERKVFIQEVEVLCGCRRRRRHYKPKRTYNLQKRSKYTYKDGTTNYSAFDAGAPVHEYPNGNCGNHPEVGR